jgi:hypothetical protein
LGFEQQPPLVDEGDLALNELIQELTGMEAVELLQPVLRTLEDQDAAAVEALGDAVFVDFSRAGEHETTTRRRRLETAAVLFAFDALLPDDLVGFGRYGREDAVSRRREILRDALERHDELVTDGCDRTRPRWQAFFDRKLDGADDAALLQVDDEHVAATVEGLFTRCTVLTPARDVGAFCRGFHVVARIGFEAGADGQLSEHGGVLGIHPADDVRAVTIDEHDVLRRGADGGQADVSREREPHAADLGRCRRNERGGQRAPFQIRKRDLRRFEVREHDRGALRALPGVTRIDAARVSALLVDVAGNEQDRQTENTDFYHLASIDT